MESSHDMRVLIDASTIHFGGARSYIRNVLNELILLSEQDTFGIFASQEIVDWLSHQFTSDAIELFPCHQKLPGLLHNLQVRGWEVSRLAKKWKADVLFSSTGFSALWRPCPELLLLRNTIYFCQLFQERDNPQGKEAIRFNIQKLMANMSVRCGQELMFPSQAMADEALAPLGSKQPSYFINHYGVGHDNFADPKPPAPEFIKQIQQWKSEGYKILLHVSMYAPHKNMETVVEALPKIVESGVRFKWITTISRDKTGAKEGYDAMLARIDELGLQDVFVSNGYVPHDKLGHLYHSADAFVFPSYTESFGQPLLEAMASSLPVVAANRPIHRELGQDAFRYFGTFDSDDCAKVLTEVLSSDSLRATMIQRSQTRVQDFSWRKHAKKLIEKLRSMAKT